MILTGHSAWLFAVFFRKMQSSAAYSNNKATYYKPKWQPWTYLLKAYQLNLLSKRNQILLLRLDYILRMGCSRKRTWFCGDFSLVTLQPIYLLRVINLLWTLNLCFFYMTVFLKSAERFLLQEHFSNNILMVCISISSKFV